MSATADPDVERALALAGSDADVERRQGLRWLVANPDRSLPVLADLVARGEPGPFEIWMDALARLGGPVAVEALESALLRGHPGESFYAAKGLADCGSEGWQALQRHATDEDPQVRGAVSAAIRGAAGELPRS